LNDLSDEELLCKITSRSAYRDEKSIENRKPTPPPKPKFKLAGGEIDEQYLFYVLTTTGGACRERVTLIINPEHWEERIAGPYLQEVSYCDLRKHELLTKEDILEKSKDKENGFKYIAKLCDLKCRELRKVHIKLRKDPTVSQEIKEIVGISLSDIIPDKIMEELGI